MSSLHTVLINDTHVAHALTKVITYATLKGGTGKTTLSTLMVRWVCAHLLQVLYIDLDMQGSASSYFITNPEEQKGEKSIVRAVLDESLEKNTVRVNDNISIVPSSFKTDLLANVGFNTIKKLLQPAVSKYDVIVIDTGRGLENSVISAVAASNITVIPLSASYNDILASHYFLKNAEDKIGAAVPTQILLNLYPSDNGELTQEYIHTTVDVFGKENIDPTMRVPKTKIITRAIDALKPIRKTKATERIYAQLDMIYQRITGLPSLEGTPF